ncbi:hypothetical protein KKG90_00550 [Candidatus Bipolaricaulota bacterium]|nr:hypothetical protein [Candidatus Bipolaricaulota bacterium]
MSTSIRDYGVLVYLIVYFLLQMMPRLLYRNEQIFEQADIIRGFPRFRGALQLLPRLTNGVMVLFLLIVFAMWLGSSNTQTSTIHVIGIAYGTLLVLDAAFAWITGIRSITGMRQRYVVLHGDSRKPMLQFTLALLYLAVAIWFLLN